MWQNFSRRWGIDIVFRGLPLYPSVAPPGGRFEGPESCRASQQNHLSQTFFRSLSELIETFVRLAAQLQQTTWNQTELQVEEDLIKLRKWAAGFHLFASQQAPYLFVCVCSMKAYHRLSQIIYIYIYFFYYDILSFHVSYFFESQMTGSFLMSFQGGLDMQYLSSRYTRGKDAVREVMEKRHSTVQHRTISLAHGDVVEKQAALGPSTLPSRIFFCVLCFH